MSAGTAGGRIAGACRDGVGGGTGVRPVASSVALGTAGAETLGRADAVGRPRRAALARPRETPDWMELQLREMRACPADMRTTVDEARQTMSLMSFAAAAALLVLSAVLGSMARREALAREALEELRRDRQHR